MGSKLKLLAGLLFWTTLPFAVQAQGENNIWTFGYFLSLDLNSGVPVTGTSSIMSHEGCAAICDADGDLLFYSNGNSVWDKNHNVMPNGTGILSNTGPLGSTGSSTQGVAFMPFIEDTNKYYLFVLESFESAGLPANIKLRYNVIDKSLNGGLGDVVAGQKNILLDTVGSEKMFLAKGAGCYNWLVTHRGQSNEFVAWKIEASGINPAKVVSASGGGVNHFSSGEMKISHDHKKIALSVQEENTIEVHDFDRATGIVSNAIIVDTAYTSPLPYSLLLYGMEFSPDNSKLYYAVWGPNPLRQIDLSLLPDLAATRASRTDIYAAGSFAGMRAGPDGKIYICRPSTSRISVINAPNNPGASCGFDVNGVYVGSGLRWGLGNRVVANSKDTLRHRQDTSICLSAPFTYQVPSHYYSYAWSNGDNTASTIFTAPGIRTLIAYDGCNVLYDTVAVTALPLDTVTLSTQQTFCFNGGLSANLNAPAGFQTYFWSTGASTQQINVTGPGTYSVVSGDDCDVRIDTFIVNAQPLSVSSTLHDSSACFVGNNSLTLNSGSNFPDYLWSTGANTAQITVNGPGTYFVAATNACNVEVDTFTITAMTADTLHRTLDTVICFREQILLSARPGFEAYQWQGGGSQQDQWVSTAAPAYVSGYNVAQCKLLFDTFHFTNINFMPDLGPDLELCEGDSILLQPGGPSHYDHIWSDNTMQPGLMARQAGTYWVQVAHQGCFRSDTMTITERHYTLDLGMDQRVCVGGTITLDAYTPGSSYAWNTGSDAAAITVDSSGLYMVEISDGACFASDSVYVNFVHCDNCLRLPNAFTPNGDGRNDVFKVDPICPVTSYQIRIFDRWGQTVFESYSPGQHWDGTYKGRTADLGVYFYTINIKYDLPDAVPERFSGDITLIR